MTTRIHRLPAVVLALLVLGVFFPAAAAAQGDGPRSQVMLPLGKNFFVPTYVRLSGDFDFTQTIFLPDAKVRPDVFVLTYFRVFSLGGRYAHVWVNPIFGNVDGTASIRNPVTGERIERSASTFGLGDPVFSIKLGLVGLPALTLPEFAKHRQTFQLGAFVSVLPPLGSYDSDRVLNLGTNRWTFRVGTPMVVSFGSPAPTTFWEIIPTVSFYTANDDPFGAASRQTQEPLFQLETHLSHSFGPKLWGSLDLRYFGGGETETDGVKDDNSISQVGGGATLGYAFDGTWAAQVSYGERLNERDAGTLRMFRVKVVITF